MGVSVGVVCNLYNEANALPGWLEMAQWFDEISAYHAGPNGQDSTDGTIEILEKWKIPIHRGSINEGFGIVRTAAVRSCKTEWVVLLDVDERFYPKAPLLTCVGESTPPDQVSQILQEYDTRTPGACPSNWENIAKLGAKLRVNFDGVYDQGAWLRSELEHHTTADAYTTIRRHWHDFSWKRPTQNWHTDPDFQTRIVRNKHGIGWNANTRMHETLLGAPNRVQPNQVHGPFFDHYHMFFKAMEPKQRAHDVHTYDCIHWGHEVLSEEEFLKQRGLK